MSKFATSNLIPAAERLFATVWVGTLWAVGYLVVPLLFSQLDRVTAGQLAGELFRLVHFIGLICTPLLLGATLLRRPARPAPRRLLLGAMLVLVLVQMVVLQPEMAALKAAGLVEGGDAAVRFGRMHAVSSALYLMNSVLGIFLIISPDRIRGA